MLFNSLTFVVFFVVVVTTYWSIRSWQARKNFLVVASYIFYGAWNPPFAALLFSTTAMDFWLGRQIARAASPRRGRNVDVDQCLAVALAKAGLLISVIAEVVRGPLSGYTSQLPHPFTYLVRRIPSEARTGWPFAAISAAT
jgi:D-alanyl-lipoteichoic acid acyltransferase DltB (MBOAT superfamily)